MKSLLLPLSKASVLPLSSTSCVAFLGLFVQHPCPIHLAAFLFSSLSVVTISVRSKLWLKVVAASLVAGLFLLVPMMDAVLRPTEPDRFDALGKRLAVTAVLGRYHWHRMPMHILVPHLWRKWRVAGSRPSGSSTDDGANAP